MRHTTKLFWLTLGLVALAWGCFAGYEAVTAVRITGQMEARARVASAPQEVPLEGEDRELLDDILNTKARVEDPQRYTDLVLTVGFYLPENAEPRYEIPLYRLSDGTNEFVLRYPDGKSYLADTRTVLRLLTGGTFDPFFEYVTSAPTLKVLCDGAETEFYCTENGWQYRKIDNSIFLDGVLVKNDVTLLDMRRSGSLSGEMSLKADRTSVEIFYGGAAVYKGALEELGGFRPEVHGVYRVKVTAEWYDSLEKSYSGTCVYEFDLNCILPTAFRLSSPEVIQGGVLELTAEYVEDPDALSLQIGDENYSFFRIGQENYGALIPIGPDWPAGEHELSAAVGDRVETLSFHVTEREREEPRTVEEAEAETLEAWKSWLSDISGGLGLGSGEKYWKGAFRRPVEAEAELRWGTEHLLPAADEEEGELFFALDGAVYPCGERETVYAGASGRVVYAAVDEELGAGIVVLDHGLGLQSWYLGLEEIVVEVGDMKLAGDALGAAGEGGTGVRMLLSGTAVDPEWLRGRTLLEG